MMEEKRNGKRKALTQDYGQRTFKDAIEFAFC